MHDFERQHMEPKPDYLSRLNKTQYAKRHEKSMPPPASRPPREDEIMPCCLHSLETGAANLQEKVHMIPCAPTGPAKAGVTPMHKIALQNSSGGSLPAIGGLGRTCIQVVPLSTLDLHIR